MQTVPRRNMNSQHKMMMTVNLLRVRQNLTWANYEAVIMIPTRASLTMPLNRKLRSKIWTRFVYWRFVFCSSLFYMLAGKLNSCSWWTENFSLDTISRFCCDVTAAMLVYRTVAKKILLGTCFYCYATLERHFAIVLYTKHGRLITWVKTKNRWGTDTAKRWKKFICKNCLREMNNNYESDFLYHKNSAN